MDEDQATAESGSSGARQRRANATTMAVPTAKYAKGIVGMTRGVFKNVRGLRKAVRPGVLVIDIR